MTSFSNTIFVLLLNANNIQYLWQHISGLILILTQLRGSITSFLHETLQIQVAPVFQPDCVIRYARSAEYCAISGIHKESPVEQIKTLLFKYLALSAYEAAKASAEPYGIAISRIMHL